MSKSVPIGGSAGQLISQPSVTANRHGLIAGATGTGKTVSLQVLAEGFSRIGTPVFITDVKGGGSDEPAADEGEAEGEGAEG